jgi:tetratricopeptide (TPR) repeat protein
MRYGQSFRGILTAALVAGFAAAGWAQVARSGGIVRDDVGQPIKGATIRADNPDAPLGTITATTDDKGRWAIIGLARGSWTFTAEAPGFQPQFAELNILRVGTPNPPLTFSLQKAPIRPPAGIEGVTAKDLQQQLGAADELYKQKKFQEAIGAYRSILTNAPSLGVVQLQIAAAYRNLKDYDKAIEAYEDLLKTDPNNDRAEVGIALANLEKGDVSAAEQHLTRAAAAPLASREVFYNLAEIKLSKNETEQATQFYKKAVDVDASWGKPVLKLGTIAMTKGDRTSAATAMRQVIAIDPTSPEAAQARTALEQLEK